MKHRFSMVCVLMTLFACCCFYACLRDEGANANVSKEGRFFNALGADVLLQRIAAKLEQKNDSSGFMTPFVARYGYPLWADACKFRENGHTVFADKDCDRRIHRSGKTHRRKLGIFRF